LSVTSSVVEGIVPVASGDLEKFYTSRKETRDILRERMLQKLCWRMKGISAVLVVTK